MKFNSNGKLMLTGEYLALDNALVLTLPTKFGQSLTVDSLQGEGNIAWRSYTNTNEVWFSAEFTTQNNTFITQSSSDEQIAKTLVDILNSASRLSKKEFTTTLNYTINTQLAFLQDWGLGSSSTLINNIAQWFKIDPFELHFSVFNGSGYDVAAAYSNSAITYQINNKKPIVEKQTFDPLFKESIYFVHLNQKQNSYNAVKNYQANKDQLQVENAVQSINKITNDLLQVMHWVEFEKLISQHEQLLAKILQTPTIKSQLFSDYKDGVIKSLGAWGGDFILAVGNDNTTNYFEDKGYQTIFSFKEMLKKI